MKKLFIICIFMTTAFTINAQTLKGSCYDDGQGTSSWFTQVDINTTFSFFAKNNMVYIRCSNLRMNVPSNTTYNAYGATYTKADLGISLWPQNQKPWSMEINVDGSYDGGSFNKSIFCSVNFTCDEFHIEGIKADQVNIGSFRINSILNVRYNQGGDPQLEEIIKQKNKQKSQTTNTSNTTSQNSDSTNPLTTSQTLSTETSSQIPSLESQYAKYGIPTSTPTHTKKEVTTQLATQAASLAGELLDNWSANIDKKAAEREAYWLEVSRLENHKKSDKYEFVYLPLLDSAEKGDENARMILYFTSKVFDRKFSVPKREQWLQKAVDNKNIDALLEEINNYLIDQVKYSLLIPKIEKIANMGSVDAMMMLADWYDAKNVEKYKIQGGNDPKKALEWYLNAAEKGSPNAMYRLGMIYKYGRTLNPEKGYGGGFEKKWHAEYDVILDEKIAFEWFLKSLQPNYSESIYAKSKKYDKYYSCFEPGTYKELAHFYKKGKVVPKDKAKANEFEYYLLYYKNKQKYDYIK